MNKVGCPLGTYIKFVGFSLPYIIGLSAYIITQKVLPHELVLDEPKKHKATLHIHASFS